MLTYSESKSTTATFVPKTKPRLNQLVGALIGLRLNRLVETPIGLGLNQLVETLIGLGLNQLVETPTGISSWSNYSSRLKSFGCF